MANLFITEYADAAIAGQGETLPAAKLPEICTQVVPITGANATSAAFRANTRFIEICSDVTCLTAGGLSPVAGTSSRRLPLETPMFYGVNPGDKIAVILAP